MIGHEVVVEPIGALRDVPLTWYVGLDVEGTRIGDALWRGEELDEHTRSRVVALFRLTLKKTRSATAIDEDPIYLILAMTAEKVLRMKPQNLLTGLPAHAMAAPI
jgi:hypothetical protein